MKRERLAILTDLSWIYDLLLLFYFRTFASDYKADNMRRPQIIERIRKALGQVVEVKHVGMPVRIVI